MKRVCLETLPSTSWVSQKLWPISVSARGAGASVLLPGILGCSKDLAPPDRKPRGINNSRDCAVGVRALSTLLIMMICCE